MGNIRASKSRWNFKQMCYICQHKEEEEEEEEDLHSVNNGRWRLGDGKLMMG
jgi:hypothetical protein